MRIVGPLGLARIASTRVVEAVPTSLLRGHAQIGRGTVGAVQWTIDRHGDGSHVTLTGRVEQASPLDRVLLAAGGRWWLARAFAEALEQLEAVA